VSGHVASHLGIFNFRHQVVEPHRRCSLSVFMQSF
jgi:hypothetical protein